MKESCKKWYGYRHDWRKCWYSEYCGHPVQMNAQLYGTKKCDKCGAISDGYVEKENWQPKYDNFDNLKDYSSLCITAIDIS